MMHMHIQIKAILSLDRKLLWKKYPYKIRVLLKVDSGQSRTHNHLYFLYYIMHIFCVQCTGLCVFLQVFGS